MGCWNETCAISKLSIQVGDAIRFLPIVQNAYHIEEISGFPVKDGEKLPVVLKGSSGCYSGDFWVPLCYPIRGHYNDYGSIEDVDDSMGLANKAEVAQFINAFKKHCIPLGIGDNECHDVAIKDFTLPKILEALQEGRCFMKYDGSSAGRPVHIVPIAWMMIKETVWQSLLDIDIKKSGEIWKPKGEEDRTTVKAIRAGLAKTVDKYISKDRERELMKKLEDKTITPEETREILDALSMSVNTSVQRRWVWHMTPVDAPEINNHLLDVASEMEYIHSMLSILRISYAPTTGSGSQCDNHKLWKLVNKSWSNIIKTELEKRRAECE